MEFLIDLKDILLTYATDLLKSGWWVWVPVQALVFLSGRMLGLLKTNCARNSLATILLLLTSYGYIQYSNFSYTLWFELAWLWLHWFSLGIIWYVVIGFKFMPRMDYFLDEHFANDKSKKSN